MTLLGTTPTSKDQAYWANLVETGNIEAAVMVLVLKGYPVPEAINQTVEYEHGLEAELAFFSHS